MLGAIILWILTFLVAGILLILFFPFRVYLKGTLRIQSAGSQAEGMVMIGGRYFGMGLKRDPVVQLTIGPYDSPWIKIRIRKKPEQSAFSKHKTHKLKRFQKTLRNFPTIRFLRTLPHNIAWDRFEVSGSYGSQNPMFTGLFYGVMNSISVWIPVNKIRVDLDPEFQSVDKGILGMYADLEGLLKFRIIPVRVLWSGLTIYLRGKYSQH